MNSFNNYQQQKKYYIQLTVTDDNKTTEYQLGKKYTKNQLDKYAIIGIV